ncbi:helix-turn-helix transcriptional regulator [Spongiactinospora rosea]|uniref:helix-turn-helix transcriptional regulator n=1 Tax=Spongiactinospora rosea TaxID=2248750 RepID=UPI0011C04ED4|nr:helix-turn-helix transcriptional regulator [Spongiactinospora rosea]
MRIVTEHGDVAVGEERPPPAGPPAFVGRDEALTRLLDVLRHAPALVLIEGEAGIGKTRLVREALARLGPGRRLVAACPPLTTPFSLAGPVDGLVRLVRSDPSIELGGLGLSRLAGALRPLLPEWEDRLPPPLDPLDEPAGTRHRLSRALTELVERLALDVLVIEDAHWADTATLEWLLMLGAATGERKPAIVVTYRASDVPPGSPLLRLTARQRPRIELGALDVAQTAQLVASMLRADQVSAEFARFLHERTDGVPLAVEESVRLLRDRQDIVRRQGRWRRRVLDELQVPPTVRDSVLERVGRLDDATRDVLVAAAVLAEPADEATLLAVAGLGGDAGRAGIGRALAAGLLREADGGQLAFRHLLDARAVAESVPATDRWRRHRLAADVLERRTPPPVLRLARHHRAANQPEQWCRYGEAAADLAWESGDDLATVTLLLELLTSVEHPPARRLRLVQKLGRAFVRRSAPLGPIEDAVRAALQAAISWPELPATERGELRYLIGRLLLQADEFDDAHRALKAALPDLADRPETAAKVMLCLAGPMPHPLPAEERLSWLERATGLFPYVESPAERLLVAFEHATILLGLGESAGWTALRALPRSATALAERKQIARGSLNAAWRAIDWGLYEEARGRLADAVELLRATDFTRGMELAGFGSLIIDWYTGRWTDAATAARELLTGEDVSPVIRMMARSVDGLLKLAGGHRGTARRTLLAVLAEDPQEGLAAVGLGRLALSTRDAEEAITITTPAVAAALREAVPWRWATNIVTTHVDALAAAGRTAEAKATSDTLAEWVRGHAVPAATAASVTCTAVLRAAEGDPGEAAAMLGDAADAWAAIGRVHDELLARERRAVCLVASGARDDGLAVLVETQRRLSSLGATWDADRLAKLLRTHGVPIPRPGRAGRRGYGTQLSPREVEVLELVATGMTNKQIAEALFISPQTVNRHLATSMRKLNVTSRTALAISALNHGLLP